MASLVVSAGCSTSAANVSSVNPEEGTADILIGDPDLYDDLRVKNIKTRINDTSGFLECQCMLENKDDDSIRFEYQFQWFDEAGFEIQHAAEPWQPAKIDGYEDKPIRATAPNKRVKSFKVKVRRPNTIGGDD